jgi:muramidase (phage lysozyme)
MAYDFIGRQQEVFEVPGMEGSKAGAEDGYLGVIGRGSWDELVSKPLKLGEISGKSTTASRSQILSIYWN